MRIFLYGNKKRENKRKLSAKIKNEMEEIRKGRKESECIMYQACTIKIET